PPGASPGVATGDSGSWRRGVRGILLAVDGPRQGRAENTSRLRADPDYPGLRGSWLRVGAAVRLAGDAVPLRSTAPSSSPSRSALLPGRPIHLPAGPGGQTPLPTGSTNRAVALLPRSTGTRRDPAVSVPGLRYCAPARRWPSHA